MKALRVLGEAVALLVGLGVVVSAGLYLTACTALGAAAEGQRRARMEASPQWDAAEEGFQNRRPTEGAPFTEMLWEFFFGKSEHAVPDDGAIRPLSRRRADFDRPPASGLRVTWLGHSTLLVEVDGKRVLTDPVWGERTSPLGFLGPARWYAPPLPVEELPDLDAIVISHDHYDHLDHPTVTALLDRKIPWVVPLGVGAHLEAWGMEPGLIFELDWWDEHRVGDLVVTATPARHFSGRSFVNASGGGPTLWAGWSLAGPHHRVYYSGDTALFDELAEIGERLGPFDLTLVENGAYNALWKDVHLGPEQAVRAHELVKGKVMLPVHWGLFDLALHGWTEPIERVLAEGERRGVVVLSPQPGEMVEPLAAPSPRRRWWPALPWQTAEEAPVLSSGTEALMQR